MRKVMDYIASRDGIALHYQPVPIAVNDTQTGWKERALSAEKRTTIYILDTGKPTLKTMLLQLSIHIWLLCFTYQHIHQCSGNLALMLF